MNYDFKVSKMEGKVQIDVNKWLQEGGNSLQYYKMSGKPYVTYITEVINTWDNEDFTKGDYVLLSKVAAGIATSPTSPYEVDGVKYYNIPISQVMGVFSKNTILFDNLKMLKNNILIEKIERKQNSLLNITDTNTMIGKVLKVGSTSILKEGDIVLLKDNMSTPIRIGFNDYYAAEQRALVGVFNRNQELSIDNLSIINENILMKPYISKNILNSTILETPSINYEDLDYSDVHNRDLFQVYYADNSLKDIHSKDILLLNRDYTNYVYFNNDKFFIIDGKKWVSGKIIERDENDWFS